MRYSIEESLLRINARSREMKREKERKTVYTLTAMTVLTILAFVVAVYGYVDFASMKDTYSTYGSFMLPDEAGGYVVVGVLCFVAAVVITLVCIKLKDRGEKIEKKESESEK